MPLLFRLQYLRILRLHQSNIFLLWLPKELIDGGLGVMKYRPIDHSLLVLSVRPTGLVGYLSQAILRLHSFLGAIHATVV
jgi:hypothetical protein